jgi:hypothetical protein
MADASVLDRPAQPAAPVADFSLANRAVLVYYTKNGWSGAKRDDAVTREVARNKQANENLGHFYKHLLAREALQEVKATCQAAYEDHLDRTFAWKNNGVRLLPAAGIDAYDLAQQGFKAKLEQALNRLQASWDDWKDKARQDKTGLGQMFRESDYPPFPKVRRSFRVDFKIDNLPPDPTDFRLSCGDAVLARIKENARADTEAVLKDTVADAAERIADTIGLMADGLSRFKREFTKDEAGKVQQKTTGVFRDSLVGNVRRLAGLLPSLNLTDNPRLRDLAERIERDLCAWDADDLKDNDATRAEVATKAAAIAKEASAILAKVDDFI